MWGGIGWLVEEHRDNHFDEMCIRDRFKAAAQGGAVPLVIIGVISSGVAAYFYVKVIVSMFFNEPTDATPHVVVPSLLAKTAITVCALITVGLGIFPQPLLELADNAAQLLR